MKLLAFLVSAAALMALLGYDYYAFANISRAIAASEQLSSTLADRGREQYVLQKNYSSWLERNARTTGPDADPLSSPVYSAITDDLSSLPDLASWDQLELRQSRHRSLMQLKAQYNTVFSEEKQLPLTQEALRQWTDQMVALLDEIQSLDEDLLGHLSITVDRTINRIGYINVSVLLGIFLLVLLTLYRDQQEQLAASQAVTQEMEGRQQRLEKSQKVYLSLMEDLSLERNEATRLSGQLTQTNKTLQQRNAEMEQFIYTVSHDLKSPLVTISGFTRKLAQDMGAQLSESQAHYFARIQANIDQMEALLSDLLQLSRTIRQDLEKTELDTEAIVRDQCATLEGIIGESDTRIEVQTPMARTYANERQFAQCIANLVSNAIKYRDETRQLVIEISAEEEGQFTRVSVKDNGLGIAKKYHQQIFRIFERLGYGDGTGVGLTIVKTIVDRHAGDILLESEPGTGSTFTLLFPRAAAVESS